MYIFVADVSIWIKTATWVVLLLHCIKGNEEGDALSAFKKSLIDNDNVLRSWDQSLADPCTWFHVTCDGNNNVTRIDLGNANIEGQLVPELGMLKNLRYMELYMNKLSGSIPKELRELTSLVSLDLYQNQLSGSIPDTLGELKNLQYIRLNDNGLSRSIPRSLTKLSALQVLDLSNNHLNGTVPLNGSFSKLTPLSFRNNSDLCYQVDGVCIDL